MADSMTFPKTWEQFLHDYEFEDSRRIYTNGARLIPSFRVKQMMEHYLLEAKSEAYKELAEIVVSDYPETDYYLERLLKELTEGGNEDGMDKR